jgi:hypothetical protein
METMKATMRKLVLPFLAVVLCGPSVRAQVYTYNIFKVAVYHQIDSTQPTMADSPNAYYLGAQLNADTNYEIIDDASLTTPNSIVYPMTGNPVPTYFTYNSDYYADLAGLDADYPSGNYVFSVNDGDDSGMLTEPAVEIFTSTIPYFAGDTWGRMQAVDPGRPLKLCWNNFMPNPDATSAYIFVRILDPSFNYIYTTNFLASDVTNICLPAYSLYAGITYQIQLLFSDRADNVNYGFSSDAPATAGFDVLSYTSLNTLAPVLCIAPGTNAVILSWSVAASNYALESTRRLSPAPAWCPVTNTPAVINNQNVVVLPTCHQAQFFRLYQVSQP